LLRLAIRTQQLVIGTQTGDWRQILGPAIGGRRLAVGAEAWRLAVGAEAWRLAVGAEAWRLGLRWIEWDLGVGNLERRDRERRRREGDAIEK
jgi:hypothetical protein